jgi:glucan phosphoethanolaminetransferase (alkaline phosphatase superfamily)
MAIFLLVYIIFLIIWLIWSLISTYHLFKYRFPNSNVTSFLLSYWLASVFILVISVLFIARADWTTVPLLR